MPLTAVSTSFFVVFILMHQILHLAKKTKIVGAIWIVAALINLGLNIAVVPHLGILGAAITTLIAYGLALILVIHYSFSEFRFTIDWRFIAKSLIASAVMSLAILQISPRETLTTILTIVAGVAIYGVALVLLKGFRKGEVRFLRELLRKTPKQGLNDKGDDHSVPSPPNKPGT